MKQAHKHVASYFGGKEVMSCPTFNNFMRAQNQARNGIKEEHRKWLQEFVAKHTIAQVTGPQVEGAGPQVESTAVQGATVVVQAGAAEARDSKEAVHSNDMQVGDILS